LKKISDKKFQKFSENFQKFLAKIFIKMFRSSAPPGIRSSFYPPSSRFNSISSAATRSAFARGTRTKPGDFNSCG